MVWNSISELLEFYITCKTIRFVSWRLSHIPPSPSPLALASAISAPSSSDSQPKSNVPSAGHDDSSFYIIFLKNEDLMEMYWQLRVLQYYHCYLWFGVSTDLFLNVKSLLKNKKQKLGKAHCHRWFFRPFKIYTKQSLFLIYIVSFFLFQFFPLPSIRKWLHKSEFYQ